MNILTDRAIATPRVAAHTFTDAIWNEILGHLATVVGQDAYRYQRVPAAKIVASIGYLSGSEDPDRFALSNLLTFHGATKARVVFNHRPSDDTDVLRRLATIQFGTLADPETVAYGMNLLALISLGDHEHDIEADKAAGKYNPVSAGQWDVDALRTELNAKLANDPARKSLFDGVVGLWVGPMQYWSF